MKWGNVLHHYLCYYINYCILYNEKADEKPKKNLTEPWQHYVHSGVANINLMYPCFEGF